MTRTRRQCAVRIIGLLSVVVFPAYWLTEYSPPFAAVEPIVAEPVAAGQTAIFKSANVMRDLDRDCSVRFSRHFIDSGGVRFDYAGISEITAGGLREMSKRMQDGFRVAAVIPAGAVPGYGDLVTELFYTCNPMQIIWPIQVTLRFPVLVLVAK